MPWKHLLSSVSFFPCEHLAVIWWHLHSLSALVLQIENKLCPAGGRLETTTSLLHLCTMWRPEYCCIGSKLGKEQIFSFLSSYLLLSTSSYGRALNRAWLNGQWPKWHLSPSGTAQCAFGSTDGGGVFTWIEGATLQERHWGPFTTWVHLVGISLS